MAEDNAPDEMLKMRAEQQAALQEKGQGTDDSGYDLGEPLPIDTPSPDSSEPQPQIHPAQTAFLVIIDETGAALATSDVNVQLALQREATAGDFYRASAEIMKDIEGMETAQRVQQVMLATSQAVMRAQQDEQERQRVAQILQQGLRPR